MAITSVKDYCTRHSAYYRVAVPACTGSTWQAVTGERRMIGQPEIYEAVVRASVRSGTASVAPKGEIVCDAPVDPHAERGRYGDPDAFWARRPDSVERVECAVHFMAAGPGNWFHWVFELLPRLDYLTLPGKLLVDERCWQIPQFRDSLRALTDREVIPVPLNVQWDVPNLVMLGRSLWLLPDLPNGVCLAYGDVLIAESAVAYLRKLARPRRNPKRKLWITRVPRTAPLRLQNEPQIREYLQAHGFTVIRPHELTFAEQIEVFGDARVIAGESGAAFTNLLWAPPTATVICLRAYPWPASIYADVAGHMGQTWVPVDAHPETEPINQAPFTINPSEIPL